MLTTIMQFRVICILALWCTAVHAIVVRIRSPSGIMSRIDVNDEERSIKAVYQRLRKEGTLPEGGTIRCRGKQCDMSNISKMHDVKLENGEIIDMVAPRVASSKPQSVTAKAVQESSPVDDANVPSTGSSARKTIIKKNKNVQIRSVADMTKYRESLVKVARQKKSKYSGLELSPSSIRILNRCVVGGVSLLLGEMVNKTTPSGHNAIVKVYTAYEIIPKADFDKYNSIVSERAVSDALKVASSLGLHIVGCSFGVNEVSPSSWHPMHIHTAVQLQQKVVAAYRQSEGTEKPLQKHDFVLLRTSSDLPKDDEKPTENPASPKKRFSKKLSTEGLSLEAFHLTDALYKLVDSEVFPVHPTVSYASSDRTASKIIRKKKEDDEGSELKVVLNSATLVQNKETKEVDPVLLLVPVAIRNAETTSTKKGVNSLKKSVRNEPKFASVFPTPDEMVSGTTDGSTAAVTSQRAAQYLVTAIDQVSVNTGGLKVPGGVPGAARSGSRRRKAKQDEGKDALLEGIERFRDVHLLGHLSQMIDERAFKALCSAVMKPPGPAPDDKAASLDSHASMKVTLPGNVQMALSTAKMTLSAQLPKRRRGASGDNDDEL